MAAGTAAASTTAFTVAAYAYPWDVVGDPAAPALLAGLGLDHVTVAAFYHGTRALTPRHPEHRVVVAEHSASYLPVVSDGVLVPRPQTWVAAADAFGATAAALAAAGLPTHAWVVLNHVDALPGPYVVNAYGDTYSWALCPAQEEVRDYGALLAGTVATRPDVSGIEFEAAGWYGFDHLHQHDKVSGVPLDQAEQFLFSLCFCGACRRGCQDSGVDPDELAAAVRSRLDALFHGEAEAPAAPRHEGAAICEALGDLAEPVLAMRGDIADRFRSILITEVRKHRPDPEFPVVFHGNPRPHRSTAFTGLDPAALPDGTTGVVVNCWDGSADNVVLTRRPGLRTLAGVLGIQGLGARAERHAEDVAALVAAGADGLRVYHAGLASAADLAAIRDLVGHARRVV